MSAQLQSQNSFSARLALATGVAVTIDAPTLESLAITVAKVQGTAANDTPAPASGPKPAAASTPAPASAPAVASGSAQPAADGARPTYDDVKARVLALAKISRDTAAKALAEFKVDHANKLKLEDYPAFIAAADKTLAPAQAA